MKVFNRTIQAIGPRTEELPNIHKSDLRHQDWSRCKLTGDFSGANLSFNKFFNTDMTETNLDKATVPSDTRTIFTLAVNPKQDPKKLHLTHTIHGNPMEVVGYKIHKRGQIGVDLSPDDMKRELQYMAKHGHSSIKVKPGQIHAVEVLVPMAARALGEKGIIIPDSEKRGQFPKRHPLYSAARIWQKLVENPDAPIHKKSATSTIPIAASEPKSEIKLTDKELAAITAIDLAETPEQKLIIAAQNLSYLPVNHPLFNAAFELAEQMLVEKIDNTKDYEERLALATAAIKENLLPCNHCLYEEARERLVPYKPLPTPNAIPVAEPVA